MGFLAERFPDEIARGALGGPGYSTTVTEAFGGAEVRNTNWPTARHKYNVSQGIKTDTDARLCDAFFRKARGRAHAFRFKDWADFTLAAADSRLVLISGNTYQISKVYGADEATYEEVRALTRIVAGTLTVYSAGVPKTVGVDYTVDMDTGRVTTALGSLTAACEFDVPCRFDFDAKKAGLVHVGADGRVMLEWEGIDIIEVVDE
jgi:uncharacterized protein (TIGR02217 family)